MRFWDTSALIPLLVEESASEEMRELFTSDPSMAVWWGATTECASAAARLRRRGVLTMAEEDRVLWHLSRFREDWTEILPSDELRATALRLLRVHPIRAADAMQLAAALVWTGSAAGAQLVTLDERLEMTARLEGFSVLPD